MLFVGSGFFGRLSSNMPMEVSEKFRGGKYGAVDMELLLPRPFIWKTRTWLLSVYAVGGL